MYLREQLFHVLKTIFQDLNAAKENYWSARLNALKYSSKLASHSTTTTTPAVLSSMPPKAANSAETAELIELFKSIGLTQSKAAEAAKSPKSAATLKEIIEKKQLASKNLDEKTSVLLATVAVQSSKLGDGEREYAVDAILDGRLKSTDQVSGMSSALYAWK